MNKEQTITSDNGDTIHVVLSVYDPRGTYSRHAGVVMVSIFERTQSPVCVHILHDETMTERNRARFKEIADTYGQSVKFHDVSPFIKHMSDEALQLVQHSFSIGSLFRLLIPDILALDKVIYLDSDIVVNLDIQGLWDISVDGYSFAGILDLNKIYRRFSPKSLGLKLMKCDRKTYINSGVLLMNVPKIREKCNLVQESVWWFKRYRHLSYTPDQDFINSCFQGDIKIIEDKFNNCHPHSSEIYNSILHMPGITKPWNALEGSDAERLYWKTWIKTPWGCLSPDDILDIVIDVVKNSPVTHRHTSQCYGKIFSRIWKDIFCNDAVSILGLLRREMWYRVKTFFRIN
ncbi:hypothetical protein FACS1894216_17720 [Synergistales bacterium]|nr:hypothetical protein FACS1894216_17720 [Synergistales bacterium]